MDVKEKQKLKKFIKELSEIRGRHTELVSVYIPAGYEMTKIINHLSQEQGTATNIKDKTTRTNVIDSLERMIRHLRLFKATPKNGLAVFAGNKAEREGQQDIQVWSVEPPEPLSTRLYRCDQYFVLDLLKDMLDTKETYGLLVVDRRDGDIGLLKGTAVLSLAHFSSDVPGKTTKGGQCLVKESIVQVSDGDLLRIDETHNPLDLKSVNFNKNKLINSSIIDKWKVKKKEVIKIITAYPRLEIESSKDHVFFIRGDKIEEKPAELLKVGDYLLIPEKIEIKGEKQKLNFGNIGYLEKDFAQFLGYFIGDGNYDNNRLIFSEGDEEVVKFYKKFFDKLFNLDTKYKFRDNKNYYELRIYNKKLVEFMKKEFKDIKVPLNTKIPKKILKSENNVISGFINGLFDAEGYCTKEELSIGMNNKMLLKQLQMLLLRFSVISSYCEYDNRRNRYTNNVRYTLRITDKESLINFRKFISFSSENKKNKLDNLIEKRTDRTLARLIIPTGKTIRRILEHYGYKKQDFLHLSNFFYNKRQMGKKTFYESIMKNIKNNKKLYNKLDYLRNIPLLPVKIKSIKKLNKEVEMMDISVKNQNFIANCVLVHNSQARYARIREAAAKDFFKKVGEAANQQFNQIADIKGILVGGPGPTKEIFLDGDFLQTELKKKVIGVKDLSYTGEFGLHELVDKSQDVLMQQDIAKEKKFMERFFNGLNKEPDKVAYGEINVKKALEAAAVDLLLISVEFDENKADEFEKLAAAGGSEIAYISVETREGIQLRDLGGVGAMLRFAVK